MKSIIERRIKSAWVYGMIGLSIVLLIGIKGFVFVQGEDHLFEIDEKRPGDNVRNEEEQLSEVRFYNDSGDTDMSNVYEEMNVVASKSGSSNKCDDIISIEQGYIISNLTSDKRISIVDYSGELVSSIDLGSRAQYPVDVLISDRELLVGDNAGKILYYDLKGKFLREREVGFHFLRFSYSAKYRSFIFYVPFENAGISKGMNSIVITDDFFHIEKELVPFDELCYKLSYLVSDRFRRFEDKVYVNPPMTSEIVEISHDGTNRIISKLDKSGGNITDLISEFQSQPINPASAQQVLDLLPIKRFFLNDNYIVVDRKIHGKNCSIIIRRGDGDAVVIPNSTKTEGFGEKFVFAFIMPRFAGLGDRIVSTMNPDDFRFVLSLVDEDRYDRSWNRYVNSNMIIFDYKYNFDVLFETGEPLVFENSPSVLSRNPPVDRAMKVFPMPASTELNIEWYNRDYQNMEIRIFNLLGGLVRYELVDNLNSDAWKVNVSDLVSGEYVLNVSVDGALVHVQTVSVV